MAADPQTYASSPAAPQEGMPPDENCLLDWTPLKGTWTAVAGALQGTTANKADILSPFEGCGDPCSIEARVRIDSPGARASLLAFYQDKKNLIEVILMEDKDITQLDVVSTFCRHPCLYGRLRNRS